MQKLLIAILCFIFLSFSPSEDNPTLSGEKHFVQFIVKDADTKGEALLIDNTMRNKAGIIMSRMDYTSKKYLVIFDSVQPYNEAFFKSEFLKLGFEIKCYRQGIHGVDKVINQSMDCN